jgi:hypothetical protein
MEEEEEVISFRTYVQIMKREGGIKMKKKIVFLLTMVCLGVITLLIPSYSGAFPPIKLGEETELNFYGFLRNNLGMFVDNPQPFSQSSNDLATARTWLRGNVDFKMTNQLRFGAVIQFVYEPEYDVEKGALTSRTRTGGSIKENGKEYSEYKDINDILRECYLEWKPAKEHSIKIGRQIAIWGESLTTRVGDVIHPEDTRFTFAFANLEDTRIPSWMIRGVHDIPAFGSSIEWIFNPNLVQKEYRVNRSAAMAVPLAGNAGERFGLNLEERFLAPRSVTNPAFGPPFTNPGVVVTSPASRDWIYNIFIPGTHWASTTSPLFKNEYPEGWSSLRGGFRTNTTLEGFNFGLSYFHTQNYDVIAKDKGIIPGAFDPATGKPKRYFALVNPNIDIIGAYMNKQLTGTGIPGVLRAEAIYIPNKPFGTFDPPAVDADAIVRRDYIKYMMAYDLNSFFYFSWHKTAPFNITFEHVGEVIPNNKNLRYIVYSTEWIKWNPSFAVNISTNWLYNLISTGLIVSYMPWGHSGLIMPSVKYTPPWLNNSFSAELKYIGIYGGSKYKGLGILETKDMIVLTTQFQW